MGLPRVHSGARAIIKISNQILVFATAVSYNITTEYKEIQGVDNSLPEELAPTKISVDITCSSLRVPKESASVLAIQPTILNHLQQKYVSIEIRDRGTNDTLLYIPRAMMISRSGAVGARQLGAESWTFKGIGYWDERPPQAATKVGTGSASSVINSVAELARKITNPFD